MTTTTKQPTQRLTIGYDHDAENPNEWGSFRVVSFNSRHTDYRHPDTIHQNDILATLSYYEHGLCRWMVGASTVPDYGGFDTVEFAGVIVWSEDATADDRKWFGSLSDEKRRDVLDSVADEYTDWANGSVYFFTLETVSYCDCCGSETGTELVESVGSYIGSDGLREAVTEYLGSDLSTIEIVGDAKDML